MHLLILAIGLGAVYSLGRALAELAAGDKTAVGRVLAADSVWGAAAVLWIATGLTRLFGELDKTLDFYIYDALFWIKMGLFLLVLALEIPPMTNLIRWRIALRKGGEPDLRRAALFVRLNHAETALVIVFVATMMARGLWLLH